MSEKSLQSTSSKTALFIAFFFGVALYLQTVNYDYVLDDKIVITANQITKKGFLGITEHITHDAMDGFWATQYGVDVEDLDKDALVSGGRYRPLTLITHSIEYGLFGESPGISHLINAILYGITGILLLSIVQLLFKEQQKVWWKTIAFWTAVLYLSHPLHVEVVANIKGRDEILSVLLGLLCWKYILNGFDKKETKLYVIGAVLLFFSLASKETTICLVGLVPLSLYFFRNESLKALVPSFGFLLGSASIYVLFRTMMIGGNSGVEIQELMNDPFLLASTGERIATLLLTFGAYLKLLVLPISLTHDYYPFHLPFMEASEHYPDMTHPVVLLGLLILLGLLFLGVKGLKDKKPISFFILFFFGSYILVSNLFFPLGVFMNDRFMYLPSIAFCMAIAYFVVKILPPKNFKIDNGIVVLGGVALVFSVLTILRNPVWKNDSTLSLNDVEVSSGSARAHMAAGDALLKQIGKEKNEQKKQAQIQKCFKHLKKALEIHPAYFPPLDLLAKLYYDAGDYVKSATFYAKCYERKGTRKFLQNIYFLGTKLKEEQKIQEAIQTFEKALAFDPSYLEVYAELGEVYGKYLQNLPKAIEVLEKARSISIGNLDVNQKLAVAYAISGNPAKAIPLFEGVLKRKPADAVVLGNLAAAYSQLGDLEKANLYMTQARKLRSN